MSPVSPVRFSDRRHFKTLINRALSPLSPLSPLKNIKVVKMFSFAQKLAASSSASFAELWQAADKQGRYDLDERAAICEYEAGFSRTEAER